MDADGPLMDERSSQFFPLAFLAPLRATRGSPSNKELCLIDHRFAPEKKWKIGQSTPP